MKVILANEIGIKFIQECLGSYDLPLGIEINLEPSYPELSTALPDEDWRSSWDDSGCSDY